MLTGCEVSWAAKNPVLIAPGEASAEQGRSKPAGRARKDKLAPSPTRSGKARRRSKEERAPAQSLVQDGDVLCVTIART
jgi:hypothetical protein